MRTAIDLLWLFTAATEEDMQQDDDEPRSSTLDPGPPSTVQPADQGR
jgi:hypothetical protein